MNTILKKHLGAVIGVVFVVLILLGIVLNRSIVKELDRSGPINTPIDMGQYKEVKKVRKNSRLTSSVSSDDIDSGKTAVKVESEKIEKIRVDANEVGVTYGKPVDTLILVN